MGPKAAYFRVLLRLKHVFIFETKQAVDKREKVFKLYEKSHNIPQNLASFGHKRPILGYVTFLSFSLLLCTFRVARGRTSSDRNCPALPVPDYGLGILGKCLYSYDVERAYERWLQNILNIR